MIDYYMQYMVHLTSDADYAAAMGLSGGSSMMNKNPRSVAAMLGIPYPYPSGDLTTIPKTIIFTYPFSPGEEYRYPGASGIFVNDAVDFQIVPGQAGNPATTWPAGQDGKFIWTAIFIKANGGQGVPAPINTIPQRRWCDGFEWAPNGSGGSGAIFSKYQRNASRTIDGIGFALRGNTSNIVTRQVNEYRAGLAPATSWERFYMRVRALPTIQVTPVWRTHGNVVPATGFALALTLAGEIKGYSVTPAYVDKGVVFTPNIDEWYLIDIFEKYATGGGTSGVIKVYVNHTEVFSYTDVLSEGLNNNASHTSSDLAGDAGIVGDVEVEVDFDDWICADIPGNLDPATLTFNNTDYPPDWLMGSHVRGHFSQAVTPGAFVGNLGALNRGINPKGELTNYYESNTNGDTLEGLTDALLIGEQPTHSAIFGPVSAIVSMFSTNAGATDGKLGYKKAGAAAVLTTVDQIIAGNWTSVGLLPSGNLIPEEFAPLSIVHKKSTDANVDRTFGIMLSVEYIGVWAEEDDPAFILPFDRKNNLHNCRYENTGWGYVGPAPAAPVFIVGGIYIGNAGYQEVDLPAPCHFLWTRPFGAGAGGGNVRLFGAGLADTSGTASNVLPNTRIFTNSAGVTKFAVSGSDASLNALGVTYQYIAFCDPGGRFNLCSEFGHHNLTAVPKVNSLIDPAFTPIAGFFQKQMETGGGVALIFKGPSHAGTTGVDFTGAAKANVATFGVGTVDSYADLHVQAQSQSCSLFRVTEPGCAGRMVQVCSFVGDGNANQVVPLTPVSGRFPLFVLLVPSTVAIPRFRDPSHVLQESSSVVDNSVGNNGIQAVGIDEITVGGAGYNNLGEVYHVFAFPGSDLGMLNGTYWNPNCDPPISYHDIPNNLDGDIVLVPEGGLYLGGVLGSGTEIVAQEDLSGIYTLVLDRRHDTLQDRLPGQPTIDFKIPNPFFKTGYIGG